MNDDFLHRLRQPPPAPFAARLRARVESLVAARRRRRRQITLYSLLACLMGSTAVALIVPSVREATHAMLREVLPQTLVEARVPSAPLVTSPRPMEQVARPQLLSSTQQVAPALPLAPSATAAPSRPADHTPSSSSSSYAAGGGLAATIRREPPAIQINLGGVAQTAPVLASAISEFQRTGLDVRINSSELSNERAFVKLCAGEIEMALTTRLIAPPELETCRDLDVELAAVPVAYEAEVVLANSADTWFEAISREELKMLFAPRSQSSILVWSQLRRNWPAISAEPFATASDLVAEVGPEQRANSSPLTLEANGVLLQRLQRTAGGLTHVPIARYLELEPALQPPLRVVTVVNDDGAAVLPSRRSIADGSYPLVRPLLLFVKRRGRYSHLTEDFVRLTLRTGERRLVHSAYLPLAAAETALAISLLNQHGSQRFELAGVKSISAREIILRQFPENERQLQRSKLPSN